MSITVVIADDHAIVRAGLKLLLETQNDISVIGEADNGREAVKIVKKLSPRIAILDIAMPELNGIETAIRLREAAPNTRVIILSMYSTSEHIYRALQAGALGYLLKESAGSEIIKAVRCIYAGRRYLSEKIGDTARFSDLDAAGKSPLESLSEREREVLQLVVEGKSSAEIAVSINLSPKTVETYRSRLMQKLGVHDVAGLVKFSILHGLTGPE